MDVEDNNPKICSCANVAAISCKIEAYNIEQEFKDLEAIDINKQSKYGQCYQPVAKKKRLQVIVLED